MKASFRAARGDMPLKPPYFASPHFRIPNCCRLSIVSPGAQAPAASNTTKFTYTHTHTLQRFPATPLLRLLEKSSGDEARPPRNNNNDNNNTVSATSCITATPIASTLQPTKSTTTPPPIPTTNLSTDFEFALGYSLFPKRPARPLPSPFSHSPPDPTSTAFSSYHFSQLHHPPVPAPQSRRKTALDLYANGEIDKLQLLRGVSNGDDAAIASTLYLGVADGVGAWNTRPNGHAALWSRLILHFWAIEIEHQLSKCNNAITNSNNKSNKRSSNSSSISTNTITNSSTSTIKINPIEALQLAHQTVKELTPPWQGTTTACLALMTDASTLTVLNLGDSQCFIYRPREHKFIFKTVEQWHWFDCPRQLGTNSHDTPREHAVVSCVEIEEGDVVVLATDGLPDNLWDHEILGVVMGALDDVEEGGQKEKEEEEGRRQIAKAGCGLAGRSEICTSNGDDGDDDCHELCGNSYKRTTSCSNSNESSTANGTVVAESSSHCQPSRRQGQDEKARDGKMQVLADRLVSAAREIATNPFAESPYMERGFDHGLVIAGGKLDDITVVVGQLCRR